MDPTAFRKTLGLFGTGVTVVTTPTGEKVHGMTANSFTSVSLHPPLILVSVDKRAQTHLLIPRAKRFGVSILRENQVPVSRHFAGKPDPVAAESLRYDWFQDIPVLSDCLASLACRLWATYEGGDHTLYLGEVVNLKAGEGRPLLFFQSAYHAIGDVLQARE